MGDTFRNRSVFSDFQLIRSTHGPSGLQRFKSFILLDNENKRVSLYSVIILGKFLSSFLYYVDDIV